MATRLTLRRLYAIDEALGSRLAGEIDILGEEHDGLGAPLTRDDYEKAADWVAEQIARRESAA